MPDFQTEQQTAARKARLDDVAREAGVSISTASRAVRGDSSVRTETADRVQAAASRLGYLPPRRSGARSRGARTERSPASQEKVAIVFDAGRSVIAVPKLLEGISLTLRAGRLAPFFVDSFESIDPPLPRAAVLVHPQSPPSVGGALGGRVRMITVGERPDESFDAVIPDYFGGIHRIVTEALALGHRRIAVMCGPLTFSSARLLRRASMAAIEEAGRAQIEVEWSECGWDVESGYVEGRRILAGALLPTLIAASGDLQAQGVLRAAREAGLRVPLDLSVTGFGGIAAGPGFKTAITSARVDQYALGVVAAQRMMESLSGPAGPTRTIVLPTERVAGQTLSFARAR